MVVWPIILLLGILFHFSWQRHQIDKKLLNPNGLIRKPGGKQFTVQVNMHEKGELLYIDIEVLNSEKKGIYKKTEIIDRDMFGGGFVRAVQIDQDTENEILIWHARAKYYLDFSKNSVAEISLKQAPREIKDLAQSWHRYHVMAGLEMTILFILALGYYVLLLLLKGIVKLIKRVPPIK